MKKSLKNVQIEGKPFLKLEFYGSVVFYIFLLLGLVSNASFNCYPNNSLSTFTSFYRQKYILKENERLLFQKDGILHCTKKLLMERSFHRWARKL